MPSLNQRKSPPAFGRLHLTLDPGDLLLGVDPGETTGLCFAEYVGKVNINPLLSIEWDWNDWEGLIQLLLEKRPKATICEYFRVYKHKGEDLAGSDIPSAQVIGALRGWNAHPLTRFTHDLAFPMASEIQYYEVLPEHRAFIGSSEHRKDSYKHIRAAVATSVLRPLK